MKFWNNKAFHELRDYWYQKLAESGFVDQEELTGTSLMTLRQRALHSVAYESHEQRCGRQEYYRRLRELASEATFDSDIDRIIITMTAEGARQKEIELALNAVGVRRPPRFLSEKRRCRESIRLTVRKYERRWGLRQDEREVG